MAASYTSPATGLQHILNSFTSGLDPAAQGLFNSVSDFVHGFIMYIRRDGEWPFKPSVPAISLDAAGIVALADLSTVQVRTALTGTTCLLDLLVLCPGLHQQQNATELNKGEYPACGAMHSGYVFRVENPATVYYLQRVGRTGQLTEVLVTNLRERENRYTWLVSKFFSWHTSSFLPTVAYLTAVLWAVAVIVLMGCAHDWWGVGVVAILVLARLCNIIVIRRRSQLGWKGTKEPGVKGDMLILLSQDRWIRMKGMVDDLKAVTSGQWLRDEKTWEGWLTAFATMIVYLDAALASNVEQFGKLLIILLLFGSVSLLAFANSVTDNMQMHGCELKVGKERKTYERRLLMAKELIKESGRSDWAKQMGLIVSDDTSQVIM